MKNRVLVLVIMLSGGIASLTAQDIINWPVPYYHTAGTCWNDFDADQIDSLDQNTTCRFMQSAYHTQTYTLPSALVQYENPTQKLCVYGVALALWIDTVGYDKPISDNIETSADSNYFYVILRTYKQGAMVTNEYHLDTLTFHVEKKFYPMKQTPSYYFKLGKPEPASSVYPPMPVYEVYFDDPVMIYDSVFYIGIWDRLYFHPKAKKGYDSYDFKYLLKGTSGSCTRELQYGENLKPEYSDSLYGAVGTSDATKDPYSILWFPILEPHPVGIAPQRAEPDAWLSPNPATDRVTVTAETAIDRIEVLNLMGERLCDKRLVDASGITLDVGPWPAGIYLVRIHTARGPLCRRLVVQ